MFLSWPPRYTSIHGLNKIINSPNLHLSSLVLASPPRSRDVNNIFHFLEVCTVISYTVTDSADSRFDTHFIWRSNDAYKMWIYMKWMVGKRARFWLNLGRRARTFVCRYFSAGHHIGARWFQRVLTWPVVLKSRSRKLMREDWGSWVLSLILFRKDRLGIYWSNRLRQHEKITDFPWIYC